MEVIGSLVIIMNVLCQNMTGKQFTDCVEKVSFSICDIFKSYNVTDKFKVAEFFIDSWWGIAKSVQMQWLIMFSSLLT